MSKKLIEAVNILGAKFIGSAKGFDLFEIETYEASEKFVVQHTPRPAGEYFFSRSQTLFNNVSNIKWYLFAEKDTNKAYASVIVTGNEPSYTTYFQCKRGYNKAFSTNLFLEHPSIHITLPLFLIPGVNVKSANNGLVIRDKSLYAVLPQLMAEEEIDLDLNEVDCVSIEPHAFDFGMRINKLTLSSDIAELPYGTILDAVASIHIPYTEKPLDWTGSWFSKYEDKVVYMEADEIEKAKEKKIQKLEQVRLDMLSNLKYIKQRGTIVIVGVKPSFKGKLIIPSEIEDLPVTEIGAYAFYLNDNISEVKLPETIKKINKGAFACMQNMTETIHYPAMCDVSKTAFSNTPHSLKRRR